MNNLNSLIDEINNELKNEECVKEFLFYKNLVVNDKDLITLSKELKFHQKEMCKNKKNPEVYEKEKALYEECKIKLDNHPILINYQIAKEEVCSLLVDIKDVLS